MVNIRSMDSNVKLTNATFTTITTIIKSTIVISVAVTANVIMLVIVVKVYFILIDFEYDLP
jgi:hypothetical protein